MKNVKYGISALALLLSGIQVASANEPNELVLGNYITADWQCTYAKNNTAFYGIFEAYPFNSSIGVMAEQEVWYPEKEYNGGVAATVSFDGYIFSNSGFKGNHCTRTTMSHVVENHRPSAHFSVSEENMWSGGTNRVTLRANASDMVENLGSGQTTGGGIEKYEWKVNGKLKTSTANTLVLYTHLGGTFNVSVKVTDNGVKSYSLPHDKYINGGDNILKLDYTYSRDIYLSEWTCGRSCVID